MNINVESHFSQQPATIDIPRSQFDRSSSIKTTFNVGDLIPFFLDEVLPGDTFNISTSKVVRFQTLIKPVMDNAYLDTYYFFVPNRLIWEHWQAFCGESPTAWVPAVEYTIPQITLPVYTDGDGVSQYGFLPGTLADYLGVPTLTSDFVTDGSAPSINALPFRAYCKIFDDWFRDENLMDSPLIPLGDATVSGSNDPTSEPCYGGALFKASKYHDYFTSALPAPQKGPAVEMPLNIAGTYPVMVRPLAHDPAVSGLDWSDYPDNVASMSMANTNAKGNLSTGATALTSHNFSADAVEMYATTADPLASTYGNWVPNNLYSELSGIGSSININDLRLAFQLQKFYEKLARGGSRYIEILKSQFGVTSPDARLQRSEYLGGNRVPLAVHEVTNNAESSSGALGNLGAFSHTVDSNGDFIKSFSEHGYVIGVCCVRYDHTYCQGLNRLWSRKDKFSIFWPVLSNIGEQPIFKKEVFFGGADCEEVFGYQEAWADYRYKPNMATAEMRPNHPQSLAVWHFGDDYASAPSLSREWIEEDKTNVDRTLQVTSSVSNQILLDCYVRNFVSRAMPVYSIPGLIDHN